MRVLSENYWHQLIDTHSSEKRNMFTEAYYSYYGNKLDQSYAFKQ